MQTVLPRPASTNFTFSPFHPFTLSPFHLSNMSRLLPVIILTLLTVTACQPSATVPDTYTDVQKSATIYPDYDSIMVPPNIAPLSFIVKDSLADEFVAAFAGKDNGSPVVFAVGADASGIIQPDTTEWRKLLQENKGKTLHITLYARHDGQWVRYIPLTLQVAEEPIDSYVSYRLIEPGYELYRQLGIYQRNLTTYEEKVVYENNRTYDDDENHCVNCHNYQANDTKRMLFHVRAMHGGTIIIDNGDIRKIAIKHDSILSAGVYPSWHPTLPLVAFSTNLTGQIFHMQHRERIEVLDEASDLLLYDVQKNTVRHIIKSNKQFETFPCWSPKGDRLFYVSADVPFLPDSLAPKDRGTWITEHYADVRYNIWSIPFDITTQTFGEPQLEVDCAAEGKSASVPRISPDGQYLLYTLADYGQFHIWHRTADLWIKPLNSATQETFPYPLSEANSQEADSYHAWSSNSRWIIFASRRDDGNFTRLYISHVGKDGKASKAFLMPQQDPRHNIRLLKSYNVPELTQHPIQVSPDDIRNAVLHQEATPASYIE